MVLASLCSSSILVFFRGIMTNFNVVLNGIHHQADVSSRFLAFPLANLSSAFLFEELYLLHFEKSLSCLFFPIVSKRYHCKFHGTKYAIDETFCSCLPTTIVFASNLRHYQFACVMNIRCRSASFHQSSNQCELFSDIPRQYGSLSSEAGVVTITTAENKRLSPCKFKLNIAVLFVEIMLDPPAEKCRWRRK